MPETDDHSERLAQAVEQLSEDINGLMEVAEQGTLLQEVVDEVRTLRSAIDDLRAEIEWAARNLVQRDQWVPHSPPVRSMPIDPCAPDFAARLNAVRREDLPPLDDDEDNDDEDGDEPVEDELPEEEPVDEETQANEGASAPTAPVAGNGASSTENASVSAGDTKRRTARTAPAAANGQPLQLRIFFQRHMTDLVRLLGHGEHLAEDFQHMVQPLLAKYGDDTVKSAIDELARFEHRNREAFVRLKPEVVTLAVQIIGRPKGAGGNGVPT